MTAPLPPVSGRTIAVRALVILALLGAGTAAFFLLRPSVSIGYGPEAVAMDCTFTRYCRAEVCDGPLPGPARIVLNGPRGRSFMHWEGRPLGQASVTRGVGRITYAAQSPRDVFFVLDLAPDLGFDFRRTERVIAALGTETGHGRCTAPAPLPDAV